MANVQGMCTSFKKELLCGSHALGTQAANGVRTVTTKDVIKAALMLKTGTQGLTTTAYAATDELAASGNYARDTMVVTNATEPATNTVIAFWTPSASIAWGNLTSSGTFDCVLLYNASSTGKLAISVHTFSDQNISGGTFTLTMPSNDMTNGLIRIA